jgi:hypothetical protein
MGWKDFKKTGQVQADTKLSALGLLIVDDEKSIVTTLEESFHGADVVGAAVMVGGLHELAHGLLGRALDDDRVQSPRWGRRR